MRVLLACLLWLWLGITVDHNFSSADRATPTFRISTVSLRFPEPAKKIAQDEIEKSFYLTSNKVHAFAIMGLMALPAKRAMSKQAFNIEESDLLNVFIQQVYRYLYPKHSFW